MMKVLEAACSLILSGGRVNSILNCLIIVLVMLICAFCLFLVMKKRKNSEKAKAYRFSCAEKPTRLFRPSKESSVRATHISVKKPRG